MSTISFSDMGFIYRKKFNFDVFVDDNHDESLQVVVTTINDGMSTKVKSIKVNSLFYLGDLTDDLILQIENEVRQKIDDGSIVLPRVISINDLSLRNGKVQEKFFDWE